MTKPGYIVTLPPPTPNGGLHIGHLAGPFLASDVFTKATKQSGHSTFVTSYSDVNQSYVRVTAQRQGREPAELSSSWTADIRRTLDLFGCDVGNFLTPDASTGDFGRKLFLSMYERGLLVRKKVSFFYSPERKSILDEAGVSGFCPKCMDRCKCGICEACAYPNSAQTLLFPYDTLSGASDLKPITSEVLVLEVERFRDQIAQFYAENQRQRTRYRWLVEDALQHALPDFPVTLPGSWGIPVQHPDFADQVINPWAEVMSNFVFCYQLAENHLPPQAPPRVVNFFGFDNSYFYAIVHVALLSAANLIKWAPYAVLINEFYNLDHGKFSTSANHVLWASDVAQRHAPDAIRLFCALNSPGFEKGNFNEQEMVTVVEQRFAAPWRRIASLFNDLLASSTNNANAIAIPETLQAAGHAALQRIHASYSIERFHLRQACEDILHLQTFILDRVEKCAAGSGAQEEQIVGLAFLLKCLAQAMYPIAPVSAAAIYQSLSDTGLGVLDERVPVSLKKLPTQLFGSGTSL